MKNNARFVAAALFLFLCVVNVALAQEETSADKFLGNPLLVLTILIIIAAVAMVFHRIRK